MAVGDITRVWSASTEVAWSSGGPASLADAAFTGLTDEVHSDAGGAKVLDIQVAAKVTTAAGSPATQARGDLGGDAGRRQQIWRQRQLDPRRRVLRADRGERRLVAKMSLAAAFGGALPELFKLALENRTGLALAAGADDTEVYITGQYAHVQAS